MKDRSNESGNDWRDWREDAKQHRATMQQAGAADIEALNAAGYAVEKLTDYQFRVNGKIDLYPVKRRFHILKTGERGQYRNMTILLKSKKI